MEQTAKFELSKEYLERLEAAVEQQDNAFISGSLEGVNLADIADLLEELDSTDSIYILDILGPEKKGEIINFMEEDVRYEYLKNMESTEVATIVKDLDSDDAADIINELPAAEREEVIALINDDEIEQNIKELIDYDEDVAGGLMAKELVRVNVNWNILQAIEEIRRQAEKVDKIFSLYVVDDKDILLGTVSLKKIILSDDSALIRDIYQENVVSVQTLMSEEEVAAIIRKYDLEVVPVVNDSGQLLGRITVDDIIDVITEIAEEERQLMSGISEDVEEDDSVWMLSRARLPWLVIGVIGGLLSAEFMGLFEEDIMSGAWIALFLPLIQATGGNVGIQSSSIVVQSLANPSVFEEGMIKRLFKVFTVALLNAVVLSALVFGATLLMGFNLRQGFIVSFSLFSVVVIASLVGTATPLALNKIGFNPALASGPFITTLNDILGLGIYFYTIHLLLENL